MVAKIWLVLGIIALLFVGESLAIYAEVKAAKEQQKTQSLPARRWLIYAAIMTLSGIVLLCGYIFGIIATKDIWTLSVISITSIIIVEPIVAWAVFEEVPRLGAIIGFALGIIGLIVSLIF